MFTQEEPKPMYVYLVNTKYMIQTLYCLFGFM